MRRLTIVSWALAGLVATILETEADEWKERWARETTLGKALLSIVEDRGKGKAGNNVGNNEMNATYPRDFFLRLYLAMSFVYYIVCFTLHPSAIQIVFPPQHTSAHRAQRIAITATFPSNCGLIL